jgi:hypothetical protein
MFKICKKYKQPYSIKIAGLIIINHKVSFENVVKIQISYKCDFGFSINKLFLKLSYSFETVENLDQVFPLRRYGCSVYKKS